MNPILRTYVRDLHFFPEVYELIEELCSITGYPIESAEGLTVFDFLSILLRDHKPSLKPAYLPSKEAALVRQVEKTADGVRLFCSEVAALGQTTTGAFEGRSVLSLIQNCVPVVKAPRSSDAVSGRNARRHASVTRTIVQRRKNNSL